VRRAGDRLEARTSGLVGAENPVTSCDLHVFVARGRQAGLVVAAGRLGRNVAECRLRVSVDRVIGAGGE